MASSQAEAVQRRLEWGVAAGGAPGSGCRSCRRRPRRTPRAPRAPRPPAAPQPRALAAKVAHAENRPQDRLRKRGAGAYMEQLLPVLGMEGSEDVVEHKADGCGTGAGVSTAPQPGTGLNGGAGARWPAAPSSHRPRCYLWFAGKEPLPQARAGNA